VYSKHIILNILVWMYLILVVLIVCIILLDYFW